MDLIGNLSQAMGIDQTAATALAGAFMGNVTAQTAQEDAEAAAQVQSAVPEMGNWLDVAKNFVGAESPAAPAAAPAAGGGLLGGLMGAASSGVGSQLLGAVGGKQAQHAVLLAGVLQKVGLDQSKAMMAAPVVLQFLQSRLDPALLEKVMSFAPMLSGQKAAGAGGVMGALGGMFG